MRRAFAPHLLSIQNIFNSYNDKSRVIEYKKGAGFTLVEIMIVVGIVAILISLAIPNILRSRVIANEGAALANLKAVNSACQLYHIDKDSYPSGLSDLVEPNSNPPYIDPTLAAGRKQGYEFIYNLGSQDHFTINANPLFSGLLKSRYFYTDESGVMRWRTDSEAGPDDEIVR
jgi:prepilin-type N-terminal cleavage/methylation domain-containing protein